MFKFLLTRRTIIGAACLLLLSTGVIGAGYELCWFGKFTVGVAPPEPAAHSLADHDFRAAVLLGEYSARFLGMTGAYHAHARYWQDLLQNLKIPSDSISDAQLETALKPYGLLVLPSAVCLSEKERAYIRAFLKDGGGVICTWATGARDEAGNWRGWNFLRELTGTDSIEPLELEPPWFVSFSAGGPITAGTPAGTRVQLTSPERLQATALSVDGYWSDARFQPLDPNRPSIFQGAIVHHELERGRVVWYGFQENSTVAGGDDQAIVEASLANSLVWAGHKLLYAVDPWPLACAGVAVLALETDEDYENAAYAANALLKSRANGTFFCSSDVVRKNSELMRNLHRAGEVAIQAEPPARLSQSWMIRELMDSGASRWKLWRLVGTWASGYVSQETPLAQQTLRALAGARYRYYLTSPEGNSVRPAIIRVTQSLWGLQRERKLIRLTRMTDDDLHFSTLGVLGLEPQWIVQRVQADFDVVSSLGGLYILGYHTRGLSAPQYAGALSQLIEQWRSRGTWIATAQDVAEWWMKRSQLAVQVSAGEPNSVRVAVTSRADSPVEGAVLSIYPPEASLQARALPVGAQTPAPEVMPDPSNARLRLMLGRVLPGKILTYEVGYGR